MIIRQRRRRRINANANKEELMPIKTMVIIFINNYIIMDDGNNSNLLYASDISPVRHWDALLPSLH